MELTREQTKAAKADMAELMRRVERGTTELHAELRRARRDLERRLDQREPPALERC